MDVHTIGVVGCGQMGRGVARVAAGAGYRVVVTHATPEGRGQGLRRIGDELDREVSGGRLAASGRAALLARIRETPSLDGLAECDVVIEAIVENMDAKKRLFAALDRAARPDAILASDTSTLSIAGLAAVTGRPAKVAGTHFFHPVPRTSLLEIVHADATSDETVDTLRAVGTRLGKTTVVARDRPGFIVSALLIPYLLDAIRALEGGVATRDDIDTAMRLGCNLPLGPLALCDLIGNDTVLYAAASMYDGFGDAPRYDAPPLLRSMVQAGLLGRKSGKGFYEY